MFELGSYLWLIPILPLAAAALTALLGPKLLRNQSHWPCVLASLMSLALSVLVFNAVAHGARNVTRYYPWIEAGSLSVGCTLRADALTAFMLVTVTLVGTVIAVYSIGYMHGTEGYARYFAEVALFVASMTGLVLADNYLLMYAFWEGVGLCSYLLIGFYFTRPSAAAAAFKAFLVTRLGDMGFLLGIILLWVAFGYDLNFESVFHRAGSVQSSTLIVICILLFCGAIGKSAQFPLHVWLPDAMEGPSPVSALIHAATMVTAGVYLVVRSQPLFEHAPEAQLVVAGIGTFTALLAATIALTQNDLKRLLAYSTISQLGYMFMAVGSGSTVAAMFHLHTHAFFKALLFLAAGSVMHAMGNVIDMRKFSGLRHVLPVTHLTFLCGAAALAGVPFLTSGFWSKDEILGSLLEAGTMHPYAGCYKVFFVIAILTAALTAFYTFRGYFLTFWGATRMPEEAGGHAHESPPVMLAPLIVLAIGALLAGLINAVPFTHWLERFLLTTPYLEASTMAEETSTTTRSWLWLASAMTSLGGIALAWAVYIARPGTSDQIARKAQTLYQLSVNKFHFDELYEFFVVKPLRALAQVCRIFDTYIIDGIVDSLGQLPRLAGQLFQPMQNGLVQFYALAMVLGLTVFVLALVNALAG